MLDETLGYLHDQRPSSALAWSNELTRSIRVLIDFPDFGRITPDFGRDGLRELLVGKYRVAYDRSDNTVTILAIVHQRRGLTGDSGD